MNYLFVFEHALYYCSLLLFAKYILDCKPRKTILILSFLVFVPMLILAQLGNEMSINISIVLFSILQFPMIRVIFPQAKLRYLVFFYLFADCLNIVLISVLIAGSGVAPIQIEIISNLLTAALWCGICLSRLRNKLRQILLYTPHRMLLLSDLLFIAMMMVNVSGFGKATSEHPEEWTQFLAIGVSLLQIAVCIAFPVLIMVSASNSRLALLTSKYEQQILAQAAHYKALSEANWEVRRFRHDFKNTRIAIEKLLADGDQAQALHLLQTCADALDTPDRNVVLYNSGNGIADALLTDKQKHAAAHNTTITFQGSFSQNALAPTDLCVVLGNTVDNAIEACRKLTAGIERTVSITCNCSSGFLFLTIQNPIAEKVTIYNNHIPTTKEDHTLHGFGLLSLQSVVNKYAGTLHLSADENFFTVNIDLCLPNTESS